MTTRMSGSCCRELLLYNKPALNILELPEVFLIGSFANFLVNTWNAKWTRLNKTVSNRMDWTSFSSFSCKHLYFIFTPFVRIRKSYVWAANANRRGVKCCLLSNQIVVFLVSFFTLFYVIVFGNRWEIWKSNEKN